MNGWIAPNGDLFIEDEYSGTSRQIAENLLRITRHLVGDNPEQELRHFGWVHTDDPDPYWNRDQHGTWFLCYLENHDDEIIQEWLRGGLFVGRPRRDI